MKNHTQEMKINIDEIVQDYRELLTAIEHDMMEDEPSVATIQLSMLTTEERALLTLYSACDCKLYIFSKVLNTNLSTANNIIKKIQNKINDTII